MFHNFRTGEQKYEFSFANMGSQRCRNLETWFIVHVSLNSVLLWKNVEDLVTSICIYDSIHKSIVKEYLDFPGSSSKSITFTPAAIAKPPPSRSTTLQGKFACIVFQSSNVPGSSEFPELLLYSRFILNFMFFLIEIIEEVLEFITK